METNTANAAPEAVQPTSSLERSLDLSISVADLEKNIGVCLRRLSKNAKMPGFRPGKIPASIIKQHYGAQAHEEALTNLLERALNEKIKTDRIHMAGYPAIRPKEAADPASLEFTATFEVYPEITLADMKDIEIARPLLDVGTEELEKTLYVLQKQRVHYEKVDRAAALGDRVIIDFLGKKERAPFPGGEGKDYAIILGEKMMLPDFETAILGMKTGESKTFGMTFPVDYHANEMAGQQVTFDITVKDVNEGILPEINGEFAKALGIGNGDVDKMRAEIEANLKREVKKRLNDRVKSQVMDALFKVNPVEIPKALVEIEIDGLIHGARQDMERRAGAKAKDFPIQRAWFADQAKHRVSLGLILAEAVKLNQLQAKPEQVRAMVNEAAQGYEKPEEVVRWYYSSSERLADIEGMAVEDNVVDWVLSQAKVIDTPIEFDELMGQKS